MSVLDYIVGRGKSGDGPREGRFVSDLSSFPLVRIVTPDVAEYDSVHIPSFFEAIDAGLERGVSFAVLNDLRGLPPVDAERRQQFVDMVDARREDIEARVAGYAGVVSSPFERGVLTAFVWFVELSLPIRIFQRPAEAEAFLNERLRASSRSSARAWRGGLTS